MTHDAPLRVINTFLEIKYDSLLQKKTFTLLLRDNPKNLTT